MTSKMSRRSGPRSAGARPSTGLACSCQPVRAGQGHSSAWAVSGVPVSFAQLPTCRPTVPRGDDQVTTIGPIAYVSLQHFGLVCLFTSPILLEKQTVPANPQY